MTTTDAHGTRCAMCSTELRPSDRFCTTCGTPTPAPQRAVPTQTAAPRQGAVPTQGWTPPPAAAEPWPSYPPAVAQPWPSPAAAEPWPPPAAAQPGPPRGPTPPMGPPPGPPPRPSGRARGAVIAGIAVLAVLALAGAVLIWWSPTSDGPRHGDAAGRAGDG